jgi:hypothetical protein
MDLDQDIFFVLGMAEEGINRVSPKMHIIQGIGKLLPIQTRGGLHGPHKFRMAEHPGRKRRFRLTLIKLAVTDDSLHSLAATS